MFGKRRTNLLKFREFTSEENIIYWVQFSEFALLAFGTSENMLGWIRALPSLLKLRKPIGLIEYTEGCN